MDNASLPYLKQIAEALKKYSGASGSSTSISGITVSGGGSDSGDVAKSLETGLFAETEGAQGTVSKSAIELLKDELVKILHDAMYVTVTEGRLPVEKSAFAIMTEKLAVLATLHISDIIRHLSLTQEGGEDTELVADITMRSEGDLIADGNVIAGTADGPAEIGNILYRLDTWDGYTDAEKGDWVPSAEIVNRSLVALQQAIEQGTGGGGAIVTADISQDSRSLILGINGVPYTIPFTSTLDAVTTTLTQAMANYLLASVFNAIFEVTDAMVKVKNVGNTARALDIPGDIASGGDVTSEGDVIAEGNVIAGAASQGSEIGNVLYRLDTWDGYTDAEKGDWVPSAEIVDDRISAVEDALEHLDPSGGANIDHDISPDDRSLILGIDGTSYTVALTAAVDAELQRINTALSDYLLASIFNAIFEVTDVKLRVKKVGSSDRDLEVPGDVIAEGNVIAGTASQGSEIGNVLYRLDSWGNYIPAPAADNTEDWVPSAKIVKDKLDELEAAIDDIEPGGDPYDDTELRQQIFTLQQQNAALTTRVQALEARKQFEFVLPGETWPPTTMEENMLYIKLNQVS